MKHCVINTNYTHSHGYDHITPTLVNLHWLPVTYRVNFKIAMLAHKCIYGNAPEYLKDLIKVKSTTRKQDNYYIFKKQLKTYYFKFAYNFSLT